MVYKPQYSFEILNTPTCTCMYMHKYMCVFTLLFFVQFKSQAPGAEFKRLEGTFSILPYQTQFKAL